MPIQATVVFLELPLAEAASLLSPMAPALAETDGGETFLLFGGASLDTAEFGLASDANVPGWTQIMHRVPEDLPAIASLLGQAHVDPLVVRVSTDWDGKPLVDVDHLRSLVAAVR